MYEYSVLLRTENNVGPSGRCDGEGEGEWIACPGQGALEMQKRNCVPGRRAAALVCWEDSRITTMLHKRGKILGQVYSYGSPGYGYGLLLVRGTGRWAVDRGESFRSRENEDEGKSIDGHVRLE
ncbi:hypothetical protein H0G86_005320 [Trichoderma simmonsii]|uniref:Uncharacterized protein n=1 Tax=Trichoderma simmonsii TaxID=1491479 RepID=A0A8G0LEG9_9HYPO|nr:hypothetical protein H0G86_005320 [Trichoderma simmonsii]